MLTKKQYCLGILEAFKIGEGLKEVTEHHITMSSKLAVAMEFLSLITSEDLKEYASSRSGVIKVYIDQETGVPSTLTVRDMLSLLPD